MRKKNIQKAAIVTGASKGIGRNNKRDKEYVCGLCGKSKKLIKM